MNAATCTPTSASRTACCEGDHYGQAVCTLRKSSGKSPLEYVIYTFTEVYVDSIQWTGVSADKDEAREHGDEQSVDARFRRRRELQRRDPVEGRAPAPDRRTQEPRRLRHQRIL